MVADLVGGAGGIFVLLPFAPPPPPLAIVVVVRGPSTGVAAVVVILMDVAVAVAIAVVVCFVVMDCLHVVPPSFISICNVIKSETLICCCCSRSWDIVSLIRIFIDVNVTQNEIIKQKGHGRGRLKAIHCKSDDKM